MIMYEQLSSIIRVNWLKKSQRASHVVYGIGAYNNLKGKHMNHEILRLQKDIDDLLAELAHKQDPHYPSIQIQDCLASKQTGQRQHTLCLSDFLPQSYKNSGRLTLEEDDYLDHSIGCLTAKFQMPLFAPPTSDFEGPEQIPRQEDIFEAEKTKKTEDKAEMSPNEGSESFVPCNDLRNVYNHLPKYHIRAFLNKRYRRKVTQLTQRLLPKYGQIQMKGLKAELLGLHSDQITMGRLFDTLAPRDEERGKAGARAVFRHFYRWYSRKHLKIDLLTSPDCKNQGLYFYTMSRMIYLPDRLAQSKRSRRAKRSGKAKQSNMP